MIKEIESTLSKMDRIIVVYYPADEDGKYTATIKATPSKDANQAQQKLDEVQPLRLYGSAEEIDGGMAAAIESWDGMMSEAFDNLEGVKDSIAATKKAATPKKRAPRKKAAPKVTKKEAQSKKDEEDLSELSDTGSRFGGEKPKAAPKPEPKAAPKEPEPKAEDKAVEALLEGLMSND